MTVHDRSDPGPNEALDEPEQQVGELAPDASPPMEAEVVKPVRRRRKRTRFAVPERTAVAVRALWEQASEEERMQAHRFAMAILESWTGRASWPETAKKLGLPAVRVHQLSQQAVSGMLAGLLKQPRTRRKRGEPPIPLAPEEDPALLRKQIKKLEARLARTEDLVRVLQEFPWHRAESAAGRRCKPEKADGKKPARRKAQRRATARPKAESKREESGGPESHGTDAERA